jgi:hypothetical protein
MHADTNSGPNSQIVDRDSFSIRLPRLGARASISGGNVKLLNYVSGLWKEGAGPGEPLADPVTGEELARISSQGIVSISCVNAGLLYG